MVSATDIAAAVGSLRQALDIVRAMRDISDATERNSKILDLQRVIMEAQTSAIDAREAHSAQVDEIDALKKEIAHLKAWGTERENYELKAIDEGALAYM